MSTENDDHDGGEWDERSDLTRLEDLSEFLHEEDPDVEAKLKAAEETVGDLPDIPGEEESSDLLGVSDLEDAGAEDDFSSSSEDLDNTSNFEDSNDFSAEEATESFQTEDFSEGPQETSFADEQTDPSFRPQTDFSSEDSELDEEPGSFDSESTDTFDTNFETNDSQEAQTFQDDQEEETAFEMVEEDNTESNFNAEEESEDPDWQTSANEDMAFGEDEVTPEEDSNPQDEAENTYEENASFAPEDSSQDEEPQDSFSLPDPQELEERPVVEAAALQETEQALQPRENFQDLRDFGNAITYGVVTTGGNPPYSLILRQVKFEEDAEDIKIVLREHGLLTDENEETITQGLEQGSLLISQISEYSAIYLAHKLRRFDVELRIGLSDQLHPSKSYTREGKGLVSKYNLRQNHRESLITAEAEVDVHDIKMSTTPTLDGYNIHRYIDVLTTHTLIEEEELKRLHSLNEGDQPVEEESEVLLDEILNQFPKEGLDSPIDQFDLGLNEIYKELVVELRNEAFKVEANAVVGINFNITPMMFRNGNSTSIHYKVTCSGNAVWVVDHQ